MFYNCSKLDKLDLFNFKPTKLQKFINIFFNVPLSKIICSDELRLKLKEQYSNL